MVWTDETIVQLRAFWDEGLSTAEIGRRLGITKNAVVGKAHRLTLVARPSPIRRVTAEVQPVRRAQSRQDDGSILSILAPAAVGVRPADLPRPQPAMRIVPVASTFGRSSACCWPIGEPGTPSFKFCGDAAVKGKPYCTRHAAVAYVKVRDRRDDAA